MFGSGRLKRLKIVRQVVIGQRGDGMTMTLAVELRVRWKQRVDPPKCEHLNLELEWNDNGSTGNYNCIICGEAVAQKQK